MNRQVIYLPMEVATRPMTGECIANRFWIVHPRHGVAFLHDPTDPAEALPQCSVTEIGCTLLMQQQWPDHEVRLLPVVFLAQARLEQFRHIIRLRTAA